MLYSREAKRSITNRRDREKLATDRRADRKLKKSAKQQPKTLDTEDLYVSDKRGGTGDSINAGL